MKKLQKCKTKQIDKKNDGGDEKLKKLKEKIVKKQQFVEQFSKQDRKSTRLNSSH